jgi:hypothetical protein
MVVTLVPVIVSRQPDRAYPESALLMSLDESSASETKYRIIRAHSLMPYFSFSPSPFSQG